MGPFFSILYNRGSEGEESIYLPWTGMKINCSTRPAKARHRTAAVAQRVVVARAKGRALSFVASFAVLFLARNAPTIVLAMRCYMNFHLCVRFPQQLSSGAERDEMSRNRKRPGLRFSDRPRAPNLATALPRG